MPEPTALEQVINHLAEERPDFDHLSVDDLAAVARATTEYIADLAARQRRTDRPEWRGMRGDA